VSELHGSGLVDAYLYGVDADAQPGTEGLNAFFLLVDEPEVYNLPPDPVVPTKKAGRAWTSFALATGAMVLSCLGVVMTARDRR
jgi:formate dehydrogenase iron-sulfur subunit